MGVLVVTERIRGVVVCDTAAHRNAVETKALTWARNAGSSNLPQTQRVAAGKYGAGPTLIVGVDFPDAATADAAWDDIDGLDPAFVLQGSMLMRYTAREDGETVNETLVLHEIAWPGGVKTVVV